MLRERLTPLDVNISSNGAVNFLSSSRITDFSISFRSSASIRKFLACWQTHAESGLRVQGGIQKRRVPRCRNTTKYRPYQALHRPHRLRHEVAPPEWVGVNLQDLFPRPSPPVRAGVALVFLEDVLPGVRYP